MKKFLLIAPIGLVLSFVLLAKLWPELIEEGLLMLAKTWHLEDED